MSLFLVHWSKLVDPETLLVAHQGNGVFEAENHRKVCEFVIGRMQAAGCDFVQAQRLTLYEKGTFEHDGWHSTSAARTRGSTSKATRSPRCVQNAAL